MVDRADPVFFGAVWRFADFCQQLNAGSVYLQSVLKYRRAALRFRAQAGQVSGQSHNFHTQTAATPTNFI